MTDPLIHRPTSSSTSAQNLLASPHPIGKLKVFLGYAPGVGKTLTMLQDAYRRSLQGTDVVIGRVDVRDDPLSAQLLQKFEVLPHPAALALDIDAILERSPQLVLIDHLAYVNPAGMRHEMRFLEVEELLSAGIDVYTTLNIYQIQSQADAVGLLTGIAAGELVPDSLMDSADQVALVDCAPQDLLAHYRAHHHSLNFQEVGIPEASFQPAHLYALRELTLRYAAQCSTRQMRAHLNETSIQPPLPAHHLLVCISADPSAEHLVRAGRRMADEFHAEWTVVFVEAARRPALSPQGQSRLSQTLRLAESLGAKTEILSANSVEDALRAYAHKNHIHRLMIGHSIGKNWFDPFRRSLAERLLRLDPSMNVYAIAEESSSTPLQFPSLFTPAPWLKGLAAAALAIVPTLLGLALFPWMISDLANLLALYFVAIIVASLFLDPFPTFISAALCAVFAKLWFIPPLGSLFGFSAEYGITLASMALIGLLLSSIVSRERTSTHAARLRTEQVTQLYELSRDLAVAVSLPDILQTIVKRISLTFDRETVVLLPEKDHLTVSAINLGRPLDPSELTAAEWAFQQSRPAGANTGTFSYASFRYLPMLTARGCLGVIGIWYGDDNPAELEPEQLRLLGVFVTKAATAIERGLLVEEASQAEVLRATDKLQNALLNSISHDLRTPLSSITGVLSSLRLEDDLIDAETRKELVETAYGEAERLNRLVGNLLDMSRLESGTLHISLQPCDVQDVIGSALDMLTTRLEDRPINIDIPEDLPLVPMDYVLINQVLINLLDNAVKYAPPTAPIDIVAKVAQNQVEISVADRGPGVPEEDCERIFEKFYRVKRFEHVVGTGLGLSICKGMVEVHHGKIWTENRQGGGVRISFSLPLSLPGE